VKKVPGILLHTDDLDSLGINLEPIEALEENVKTAHRDDHYMFILQQQGAFHLEIDFSAMALKGASLCFVGPGQVHRYVKQRNNSGWFIFVDVSLVPEQYREIFDAYQHVRQVVAVQKDAIVFKSIPVLEQLLLQGKGLLNTAVIAHQLGAILGIIAMEIMQPAANAGQRNGRVHRFYRSGAWHYRPCCRRHCPCFRLPGHLFIRNIMQYLIFSADNWQEKVGYGDKTGTSCAGFLVMVYLCLMNQDTGKYIMLAGAAIVVIGLVIYFFHDKLHWIGHLPGDIRIEKENFRFYFPITTMIIASVLLTIIARTVQRFL